MSQTCTVYIRDRAGRAIAGHVTAADSVFEAARKALAWFEDDSLNSAFKPGPDTILEVKTVAGDRKWFVRAGRVKRKPEQDRLFDGSNDALEPRK